jgi:hypothetical protein
LLNPLSAAQLLTADSRACAKALGSRPHHPGSTSICIAPHLSDLTTGRRTHRPPVLVTGIQPMRVDAAGRIPFGQ